MAIQRLYRVHRAIKYRRKLIQAVHNIQNWWRISLAKRAHTQKVLVVVIADGSVSSLLSNSSAPLSPNFFGKESPHCEDSLDGEEDIVVPSCHILCIDTSHIASYPIESEDTLDGKKHESEIKDDDSYQILYEQAFLRALHKSSANTLQRLVRRFLYRQRQLVARLMVNYFLDDALILAAERNLYQQYLLAVTRIQVVIRGFLGRQQVRRYV